MRQSKRFSAAGLGLLAGLICVLVFRDGQAEQPAAKTAGFAVSAVEQPASEKPATGRSATDKVAAAKPPVQNRIAPQAAVAKTAPAGPESNFSSLTIESGSRNASGNDASSFTLAGRDSRQQLIVTGTLAGNGQLRDLTRQVHYSAEPAGIVLIDNVGQVSPQADGKATITAQLPGGPKASIVAQRGAIHQRSAGEFSQSDRPDFHQAGLQRRRMSWQGERPEWFSAVAVGFRAQRRLRTSGERGTRPPAIARRAG